MTYFKYDRHEDEWDRVLTDPVRGEQAAKWLRDDTIDAWRHNRMRAALDPYIEPGQSWLTVGDGRYGPDARYIMARGARVHCSDISKKLNSQVAHLLDEYSAQNAEALDFPDDAFDYVYCKESFHHFPRPWLAVHEMFRVARKGVILTEPRDVAVDRAPFDWLLRRHHDFEPVGNFVFRLSEHEVEKFALGIGRRYVAFVGINDEYIDGCDVPPEDAPGLFRRIKFKIALLDWAAKLGVRRTRILTASIFKDSPERTFPGLRTLPANPFAIQ